MNWIKDRAVTLIFCVLLGAGLVYSYEHDPNAGAKQLRSNLVTACERSKAKAVLYQQFTDKAAAARRVSAASEEQLGEKALAASDLSAAAEYEANGLAYVKLTPQNCDEAYPVP